MGATISKMEIMFRITECIVMLISYITTNLNFIQNSKE